MKMKTDGSTMSSMESDIIAEQDYRRSFVDNGVRTTPKERKVSQVVALKGKDKKYWFKCTSKQLGGIIYK